MLLFSNLYNTHMSSLLMIYRNDVKSLGILVYHMAADFTHPYNALRSLTFSINIFLTLPNPLSFSIPFSHLTFFLYPFLSSYSSPPSLSLFLLSVHQGCIFTVFTKYIRSRILLLCCNILYSPPHIYPFYKSKSKEI